MKWENTTRRPDIHHIFSYGVFEIQAKRKITIQYVTRAHHINIWIVWLFGCDFFFSLYLNYRLEQCSISTFLIDNSLRNYWLLKYGKPTEHISIVAKWNEINTYRKKEREAQFHLYLCIVNVYSKIVCTNCTFFYITHYVLHILIKR